VRLSEKYNCNVFLKREDMQHIRSFKIRGSFNKIIQNVNLNKNIVTASAGNHAQGVSYVCSNLNLKSHIFLPETTPLQKINRIKHFNSDVQIHFKGETVDEALIEANEFSKDNDGLFVHPFDDIDIIHGNASIAHEICEEIDPDYIIGGIGGGGLMSGISMYCNLKNIKLFGVEPKGANSMKQSFDNDGVISIDKLDTFVDGASVRTVGNLTFDICKKYLNGIIEIDNNELCYRMVDMYQNDGIILEPAGCLSIAALDRMDKDAIADKNVVCILSGGNNDIMRYPEIVEKSLIFQGLKHYFIINFVQKPGELKKFINHVLNKKDDITRFEYFKKTNKNYGSVILGIETNNLNDLINNMDNMDINYIKIEENDLIYSVII
jgi:threonine dehydratase